MSREILFRGKRVSDGKWVHGYYANCQRPGDKPYITGHYIIEYPGTYHEIYTSTVGQFTGLEDLNGKRIFEGDILQCNENPSDLVKAVFGKFCVIDMETGKRIDNVIGWHYEVMPTNALSMMEPFCLPMPLTECYINQCSMVAIGNIHDNPELTREAQNEPAD